MASNHFRDGHPVMVDVTAKPTTPREAVAEATVRLPAAAAAWLEPGGNPKGDPLAVAELAGVMAAKRTADLIPLCHPLPLGSVEVRCQRSDDGRSVRITARCLTEAQTGVEMEALTAASVAALTLYDMLKGAGKGGAGKGKTGPGESGAGIVIDGIRLLEKRGGASGPWVRS